MAMQMNGFGNTCEHHLCLPLLDPNADGNRRYVMYHSLLAVVRQRYRPVNDNEELAGRRDLTTAMRQLSAVGGSR